MRYRIKAMGVGEILDEAVKLLRNRFKLFLGITALVYIPFLIVQNLTFHFLFPTPNQNLTPEQIASLLAGRAVSMMMLMGIFTLFGLFVAWPLTNAAVVHAISNEYLDRPITAGAAIRYGLRVMFRLLATTILAGIIIGLGLICFVIPGIYLALRYWLVTYVVVVEGVGGGAALKRSKALTKGNVDTAFVLGFLLAVISGVAGGIGNMISFYPAQLAVTVLVQSLAVIFGSAASVVYYFSCRSKLENFDLQVLSETVAVE